MKTDQYTKSSTLKSFIFGIILLSSATMSLHAQTLTIQSPNGGEVWTYGYSETVTWTGTGLGILVSLEFSADGGITWSYLGNTPSTPTGGSVLIGVPPLASTNAFYRITDPLFPDASDISDEPFTVIVPPIFVINPGQGAALYNNTASYVSWEVTITDIEMLNAELSIDNGQTFVPLAQNLSAFQYYEYILFSTEPSDSCIMKLYNADDTSQFGLSGVFSIIPQPVYTLTSPVAGELVNAGSPCTITWTVENPSPYCYLEYSTDNGSTWNFIDYSYNEAGSGTYLWTTPNVDSDQCFVRVSDNYLITSMDTSGMFTIFPFPETPVCMVSVDSLTNFNIIIWEKPVSDLIANFLVYKETDEANVYEVIDTVGYEEITMVTDSGSNPAIRPYRYKIGFIDVENRLFPAGDYHQTIHLTINQGVNDSWNLIWTPYTGFDYPSYKIMRKTDSDDFEQIATVSASFSSYTDFNAPPGEVYYMIRIEHPDGCDPATRDGDYTSVYSNVATNSMVSVYEIKDPDLTIYPIPADKQLNVSFGENITGKVRLSISDLTGRVVYSEVINDILPGQVQRISSNGFKEGMYLLQVTSGENMATRKIVIKR